MAVKRTIAPNHTAALSNPINLNIGATAQTVWKMAFGTSKTFEIEAKR
jgi:hypothetical protein